MLTAPSSLADYKPIRTPEISLCPSCFVQIMADEKSTKEALGEDLEPLFDYSRVQPNLVCLDDDDDDDDDGDSPDGSLVFFLNENTKNTHKLDEKRGHVADISRCRDMKEEEEEEDDDWLPPPPKATSKAANKKLEEDPTLKELRLMKQELQLLAESAKDLSQAAEDSPGDTVHDSGQSATGESLKPPSDRFKVIISIQDMDGLKQFRVYADDKFERIFRLYTNKVNVPSEKLTFCFDGDKISPSATPESLGMEDNDIIEVHAKSS